MSGVSFQRYLGGRIRQYGPLRLVGRFLAQVWRPRAWALFFTMYRDRNRVARSPFFDADWYRREYPDVARSGVDPALHYATCPAPRLRDPGPGFCSDEYLALNPDVRYVRMNPLVHYESHGRREGRPVSFLDLGDPAFPADATDCTRDFGRAAPKHRRTALFAAFCPDGRIPETTLHYLRGLREVVDDIVFVANSPVLPGEPDRLRGLVSHAEFRHHGAYDFGSYRRAWEIARGAGMLDAARTDELVVANDSCYGPAVPFPEAFAAMAGRDADFWGMTAFRWYGLTHIQSYFFVFRRRVLDGPELGAFLSSVVPLGLRGRVVLHYECRLTNALERAGYRWDTLVPRDFADRRGCMPTKLPATLLSRYRMPLLKAKALRGDALEDTSRLRGLVARTNPALAAALPEPRPAGTPLPAPSPAPRRVSAEELRASFGATASRIARRVAAGDPVRALFTVSSAAMFPAKPLFEAMRADPLFAPGILVVPDLRWPRGEDPATLGAVRADLVRSIPPELVRVARPDEFGDYPDDFAAADIVCHDTPYDVTSFRYRPRRALAGGYLPIHVNYGFFRSVYDRGVMARQNFAYFWKVFLECPETLAEYREHSILRGANAELAGYVKMDALAAYPGPRGPRKRVLVCPHHSVEGGANDELALSNFLRLSGFLAELPARFPEIDFVLRPHPFLFEVLSRPRFWGPGKCAAWRERFLAHPNARWSEGGDYLREFAAADAMVQDCGSFLVEWMYTGRPCCFVLKSDRDAGKFAPLGRECLSHCTVAHDAAGIEEFLRDAVLGGRDPGAAARDAFRRRIAVNYPHAADAALASIRRGLGIG